MISILTRINPWVVMGLWQVTIWALVIAGILALRHHH